MRGNKNHLGFHTRMVEDKAYSKDGGATIGRGRRPEAMKLLICGSSRNGQTEVGLLRQHVLLKLWIAKPYDGLDE